MDLILPLGDDNHHHNSLPHHNHNHHHYSQIHNHHHYNQNSHRHNYDDHRNHHDHDQVRQLKFDQPGLEATLLKPTNECGVEKLICTFVKVIE